VAIVLLEPGDADAPVPRWGDFVELRYRVWDEDGRLVGASRPGRSERLATSWLPPGWAEAMMGLHVGAHAHVWVPAAQAYAAVPDGPRGALRIDVELVGVESLGELSAADVPLVAPPPDALRTASGLAFVVLRTGTGTRHAAPDGRVTVHYEGWTAADGKRFDSSYERGRPATFPLAAVIAGWQEAVPLMVEGEKTRFWIPEQMAYGDAPGKPSGMLVFDIELVRIED
jgi:peptidylprolyl isomerase